MKRVVFSDDAKADIRAIPRHIAMNLLTAIHRLAESGAGNVKRLQGLEPSEFRLRLGDWRVRFHQDAGTLRVLRVRNRREAYR